MWKMKKKRILNKEFHRTGKKKDSLFYDFNVLLYRLRYSALIVHFCTRSSKTVSMLYSSDNSVKLSLEALDKIIHINYQPVINFECMCIVSTERQDRVWYDIFEWMTIFGKFSSPLYFKSKNINVCMFELLGNAWKALWFFWNRKDKFFSNDLF